MTSSWISTFTAGYIIYKNFKSYHKYNLKKKLSQVPIGHKFYSMQFRKISFQKIFIVCDIPHTSSTGQWLNRVPDTSRQGFFLRSGRCTDRCHPRRFTFNLHYHVWMDGLQLLGLLTPFLAFLFTRRLNISVAGLLLRIQSAYSSMTLSSIHNRR